MCYINRFKEAMKEAYEFKSIYIEDLYKEFEELYKTDKEAFYLVDEYISTKKIDVKTAEDNIIEDLIIGFFSKQSAISYKDSSGVVLYYAIAKETILRCCRNDISSKMFKDISLLDRFVEQVINENTKTDELYA